MATHFIQRFSVQLFTAIRRRLDTVAAWVRKQPGVAPWIYPAADSQGNPESRYREFNLQYFASFYEQERMLADQPRMNFYHAAIQRHIRKGDRVIDLGTGTGILAAFAARAGASKVYAIDHSSILEHAKTLAEANGIDTVEFQSTHSTAFKIEEPVDVIVHEQMGDCLFDEGMMANVSDLRDRLLKPGGRIIPSLFEFYCEPVEVKSVYRVPFLWELNVHGYSYAAMEWHRPQNPEYYQLRSSDPGFIDHFLGKPEPILEIDLHTVIESNLPQTITLRRTVDRASQLDGYVIYFRALVDADLSLSSAPLDPARAPHWGFRILRTEQESFEAGDIIEVRLAVESWADLDSWRWSHVKIPAAQGS